MSFDYLYMKIWLYNVCSRCAKCMKEGYHKNAATGSNQGCRSLHHSGQHITYNTSVQCHLDLKPAGCAKLEHISIVMFTA